MTTVKIIPTLQSLSYCNYTGTHWWHSTSGRATEAWSTLSSGAWRLSKLREWNKDLLEIKIPHDDPLHRQVEDMYQVRYMWQREIARLVTLSHTTVPG